MARKKKKEKILSMDQGQVCDHKVGFAYSGINKFKCMCILCHLILCEHTVHTLYMYIYVDRCRELERRRWAWRHATAAKQARFTIITNRAYVPRPDRNTTEWPPDLKSSGTSQPASKAWFGPHIWRAHAYGPSNGNATSVSDDASLCKLADLSYHSYGICNALLSFHAKKNNRSLIYLFIILFS